MKEKNIYKKSAVNYGSMFFKVIICLACLMLLHFDLLTFITGLPSARADELIEYKLPQADTVINTKTSFDIRSQLWMTDITPLKEENEDEEELKLLIDKINTVELMTEDIVSEETEITEQVTINEPNDVKKEPIEVKEEGIKEIETDIQYNKINNFTLKKIIELTKQPEKVHNPFELGETLFLSDNLTEAAIFYKEALRRQDPNDISSVQNRAWLLFQTGNCLRDYDRNAAKEYYGKLITEYPDLQWAELAKIQSDLIDWYNKNNPQELILEYRN